MADVRDLWSNGTDNTDETICLLFLHVLSRDYDVFRPVTGREKKPLNFDGLTDQLLAIHGLSNKVKSSSSDTAFIASILRREKAVELV